MKLMRWLRWPLIAAALCLSISVSALTPQVRTVLTGALHPALDLNFLIEAVPNGVTFSGGANGTRVNSAGNIVAATAPRFDYNPTTLAIRGLLVEEARTNLLLNSKIDGTNLSTQSVSVTAQSYTLSFYGTGTATLSGTSTGAKVGTGAYPTRSTFTFTPTAGTLTLTVTGTVQFAQLEAGSFATSFIPTGASGVTRTADNISMTGANFSSWFNAAQGTFLIELSPLSAGQTGRLLVIDNGSGGLVTNGINLDAVSGAVRTEGFTGGVSQWGFSAGTLAANTPTKIALAVAANDIVSVKDGSVLGTDSSATLPSSGITTLTIGSWNGASQFNSHITRVRNWPRRLPNATDQGLSTP